MYNTRYVCPDNVTTFSMDGYFHTMIWLREYPCEDTTSFTLLDHMMLHTCEPVSTLCSAVPVVVFQNRIVRSAVPPPDATTHG